MRTVIRTGVLTVAAMTAGDSASPTPPGKVT
ncbi:hypothetical protein EV643_113145 [Kribbella sp. VKM Ac-2527]|uniref:Uncharacterized protein n=1 Tax=Kribbella caucasensis TaxID=2512215 RepID=A0A4R6KCB2_9ACTN|nr:hypothetical protein EV643_113145 [Kribbella sp. VKM Ac-2527]